MNSVESFQLAFLLGEGLPREGRCCPLLFLSTTLGLPFCPPLRGTQADVCLMLGFSEHVFLPSCILINIDVLASICSLLFLFFKLFRSLFGTKDAIYWCPSETSTANQNVVLWIRIQKSTYPPSLQERDPSSRQSPKMTNCSNSLSLKIISA